MIALLKRILDLAQGYRGRIYGAAVCSFFKALFGKAPFIVAFFMIGGFLNHSLTPIHCLWAGLALLASVAVQAIFQNLADRMQSGSGFEMLADLRKRLGERLRRMPMGFFTEGNIGRISSVLSTDMVFIEENFMMVVADLMSYLFSAIIFIAFMFWFDWRLGLLSVAITAIIWGIGEAMKKDTLAHSDARQAAARATTDAVIDFTEGMGIIKTYNILGEKSKDLVDAFKLNCDVNLEFESDYAPWAFALNLSYGLGSVAVLLVSWLLYANGSIPLLFFIGMMLFGFEV
ncbi:MAG: ABC transporter ATP-binding protein, partial [Coriobacteriales bacterium]|nr:ABC transporter ATP-binding protein [Coriobacteriales bacterium]